MPHSKLVTRIRVTGYTLVQSGLNLVATQSQISPYSPPVRYLASELHEYGKIPQDNRQDVALVDVKHETRDISTFTFELKGGEQVNILPGQHVILDFSAENTTGYRHMADEAPQSLNDDYVRSWTISSIPEIDPKGEYLPSSRFSCTIKNKYGGAVSPLLHRWARGSHMTSLRIKFIGVEGAFTCFDQDNQIKYNKLLFIAGGVGITPFLAILKVLKARKPDADVVFLFSARGDEIDLARPFQEAGIDTRMFGTERGQEIHPGTFNRRIEYQDIVGIPDLTSRGVYLCGPDGFMAAVKGYLQQAGVQVANVNIESFAF